MKILLLLSLVIFLLSAVPVSQAADYYVSPTGTVLWSSCTNIASPCSISTANANVQAGDTVYLRGGTYLISSSGIDPKNTGTEANPITFTNYNGENVIFNYTGSSISDYAVNLNSEC